MSCQFGNSYIFLRILFLKLYVFEDFSKNKWILIALLLRKIYNFVGIN